MKRKIDTCAPRLSWRVLHHDFNSNRIVYYDILDGTLFLKDVEQARRKHLDDDVLFLDEVRSLLMYYYWSKCEHEILVSGLFDKDGGSEAKIDAFGQVEANWDAFSQYLLQNVRPAKRARGSRQ